MNPPHYWYDKKAPVPLIAQWAERLFATLSTLRRNYYDKHSDKSYKAPVPVIVVGNITVGGTGKTPLVIALVRYLMEQGYHPGVISRGYGAKGRQFPAMVHADSDAMSVGDEPVLIVQRTGVPLVVDPKRSRSVPFLLASHPEIDIIISDDGLQHYALARDIEIVVIDGERRFGNERLLPAGPLREPVSRLQQVDFCVANGNTQSENEVLMQIQLEEPYQLNDDRSRMSWESLKGVAVHAVAGIGNPKRFFSSLEALGLRVNPHEYSDHHVFKADDLQFADHLPVLITEKDAVKCRDIDNSHVWVVPAIAVLPNQFYEQFRLKLSKFRKG